MSRWFRAIRSSRGDSASEPQPFELVCECNLRHTGLRKKSHQRIVCRTCGASLFVLPRDAYPPPPDADRIKKKSKPKAPPAESPGESAPVRVSRHKRRREQEAAEPRAVQAASSLTSYALEVAAASARKAAHATVDGGVKGVQAFWHFWTPLRLAGLGILVLLCGIGMWTVHARRIERAEKELNPAIEEGLQALEAADIPLAAGRLATAVAALDLLGQEDTHANSVRQAEHEARALDALASEPLILLLEQADEVVRKAARNRPQAKPASEDEPPPPPLDDDWRLKFDALYRGGWVVMEAPVHKLKPTEEEPRRCVVDFPVRVGPDQHAVELRADCPVFDRLDVGSLPKEVIFGAQLDSCRYDEDRKVWQVSLAADSGFVWVNAGTYRQLGFLFNEWHRQEDVEGLLARQAQALRVEALIQSPPVAEPALAPN